MAAERVVTLVLVTRAGDVVGALAPYPVPVPWWSEIASVVEGARSTCGAEVTVLRLLDAEADADGVGGDVTYVAELDGPVPAGIPRWEGDLADDPRRARWARPGGPAADLAWAERELDARGRPGAGAPTQQRTWNLSSIWVIPTAGGDVWLKAVPPFLAHEGRVLEALQGGPVPPLLALDREGRVLLDHVPGENQFQAGPERLEAMVATLVELQTEWLGREAELHALGVRDWRSPAFVDAAAGTVAFGGAGLPEAVRVALDRLVEGLGDRFADVAACGIPDTLVHGDFHPGNFRFDGRSLVLLDWGDSGLGHPLFDLAAFLDTTSPEHHDSVKRVWMDGWARAVPGSDPWRAARLLAPLSALRRAIVYRLFLDGIEATEQRYHDRDVPRWLERAARAYENLPL